jgi:hypothetical protein
VADHNAEGRDGSEADEDTRRHYARWSVDGVWLPHTTGATLPQRHAEVDAVTFLAQPAPLLEIPSKWSALQTPSAVQLDNKP